MSVRYWILFLSFLLTACTAPPAAAPSLPTPIPDPIVDAAMSRAAVYLEQQYDEEVGLLQESPGIGRNRFYLTNDNALAAYAFGLLGHPLAEQVGEGLDRYGLRTNDFVEVAWGEVIPWPPRHHEDQVVERLGEGVCDFLNVEETEATGPCVFYESHDQSLGHFYDWSSYGNLACMGAVNEVNQGNLETARRLYEMKLADFDGYGFADAVYWEDRTGVYETLGLAWCLYAAALLDLSPNPGLLNALLAQQNQESGGFHTHYSRASNRLADPNVETTSVTLLALYTIQQGSSSRVLPDESD